MSLKCHHKVLEMATKEGHIQDQAYALHHIGLAHLEMKQYFVGIEYLENSLTLCNKPELGLKVLEASTLNNLGNAYLRLGRPGRALDYLRPALDLQQSLQDPRMLSLTLINLGKALLGARTEPSLAVEMLTGAVEIAKDINDLRAELTARGDLAIALVQAGRMEEAFAAANALRDDAAKMGDTPTEVEALATLGELYLKKSEVELARKVYEEQATIARDRDFQPAQEKSLEGFARIALFEGKKSVAIQYLEMRLDIAIGDMQKATVSWRLGELLSQDGNPRRAADLMQDAISFFMSIKHEAVDEMQKRLSDVKAALPNAP